MMTSNEQKLDWINLPANALAESLHAPLHDGEIVSIQSDLLERRITLMIDVLHLRKHHKLAKEQRFVIQLQGVQSARANTWAVWPGEMPPLKGKSHEVQTRLVKEYQAKWREESMSWSTFLAAFEPPDFNCFDIYEAQIARNETTTTLQIHGMLNGEEFTDQFVNIFIRAEKISIEQSAEKFISVEEFIKLGEDYWRAYEARRK